MTRTMFTRLNASVGLAFALVAMTAMGGCGLSTLTSGFGGSVLGGGQSSSPSSGEGLTAEQMLTAAKSDGASTGSISGVGDVSYGCPRVNVMPREHQLTIYEGGNSSDALAVMHRGEITKTARECQAGPGHVTVKYGFSGVIRLGPKGRTGSIVLPVQVSIANAERQRIKTERINVQANVDINNPIAYFSHVQTVSFEVPPGSRPGEFELQVGFEKADPS